MASFLARLAPLVITLRGSKRMFSSAERTLRRVERLQSHPVSFEPPASLGKRIHLERREVKGWPIFELGDATSPRRALYLHGGCYVFEIDPLHWSIASQLVVDAGARVTVPIMPLAPRGTASTVVPAVADLAEKLVAEVGASNVTVIGDSSGGGMALAVAQVLRDRGVAPLGAIVLISPWLDISGADPRLTEIAPHDPWLAVPGTHAAGELYRGELSETDPLVSPLNGSLRGLGAITMFSGTRDILNADAVRFVAAARAIGHPLEYIEGEGMIHNFPILPMPEGAAARARIVEAMVSPRSRV